MSGMNDEELRQHFDALRAADLARAPSFAELSRRPAPVARADGMRARWVVAGGVGALAAAAMLAMVVRQRDEAKWLHAAATISAWQAPTDVLLQIPDGSTFGGPGALGASVLDSIIPPSRED